VNTLFGIPTNLVLLVLATLCLLLVGALAAAAGRGAVLLRLGLRQVPRRPLRTALVAAGLAVSTAVLTSAFLTGETMTYNLRRLVASQIGRVDELVVLYRRQTLTLSPQDLLQIVTGQLASGSRAYFPESEAERLRRALGDQPAIAAITPAIVEPMVAANPARQQVGSHLNVVGLPVTAAGLFDGFWDANRRFYRMRDLGDAEVFLNSVAATMLAAEAGDLLVLYFGQERPQVRVGAVVTAESIGEGQPVLILPLARLQAIVDRPGQVNRLLVANAGDAATSVDRSAEVVQALRGVLVRDDVAAAVHEVLRGEAAQRAMVQALAETPPALRPKLEALIVASQAERVTPAFKTLLGDPEVIGRTAFVAFLLRGTPAGNRLNEQLRQLTGLTVSDLKRAALERAEEYGAVLMSIFFVVGALAIAAALAFGGLVFILLAAERRSEMGVARAIGMRRGQLVTSLLAEGLAYDLLGALLGVAIGVGVGTAAVTFVSGWLASYGVAVQPYLSFQSLAIPFLAGVLLTFLAVGGAAWQVSRLNVVAAIRDLPPSAPPRLRTLLAQVVATGRAGRLRQLPAVLASVGWGLCWRGLAPLALGFAMRALGLNFRHWALFALGVGMVLLALALIARWLLGAGWGRRIALSLGAIVQLAFWLEETDLFGFGRWPGTDPGVEVYALRGLAVVGSLVWLAAVNLRLALRGLALVTGPIRMLAPAVRLAVAYPALRPWRTALAVLMVALVVFTMTLAQVLLHIAVVAYADPSKAQPGYDIRGEPATGDTPPEVRAGLASAVAIKASDFEAIGALATLPAEVINLNEPVAAWRATPLLLLDEEFLRGIPLRLVAWSPRLGSAEAAWRALQAGEPVAVLSSRDPLTTTTFTPAVIWVRQPGGGPPRRLELIGRVDPAAGVPPGIVAAQASFAGATASVRGYYFRVRPGVRVEDAALGLTLSFGDAGLRTQIVGQEAARAAAIRAVLTALLQVFLGLGLVAGFAALGILGVMAVVERRTQIGVIRALGYRRWLVIAAFLLETLLTGVLGVLLGSLAGLLLAAQITLGLARGRPEVQFAVPTTELAVLLGGVLVVALLTAALPAYQAGRVRPAEAITS
jgi:putative ABC transport system permease protein